MSPAATSRKDVARQAVCGPAIAASRSLSLGLEGDLHVPECRPRRFKRLRGDAGEKCSVAAAPRATRALHGSAEPLNTGTKPKSTTIAECIRSLGGENGAPYVQRSHAIALGMSRRLLNFSDG